MSSKDERREQWNRKKAHNKVRKPKSGFVSGNARHNRARIQDHDADTSQYDSRMGRASEAA